MRRALARSVVCLALLAGTPASAHVNTEFAGVLEGTLRPATPTLQFTGTFDGAGRYHGQPSTGSYNCTASGPNSGTVPFGGPFSGTFSCVADLTNGGAPSSATGSFQGYTNLVTVAMKGDFNGHGFNCEGTVTPKDVTDGLVVTLGVALACLIQ